ncbi:MAG: MarR family transcriptional regulator [Erysipelotrichaceae bacterium]|nr:MarR family transcriptional regulator [Erysipelotrichaceae bacterium]
MRMFFEEENRSFEKERGHHPMGRCHRRHEMHRPFESFERDREDLEGMYMACARMLRHEKRGHFGSAQEHILMLLKENGNTMSQKAIQQLMGVRPGSISEVLSKMEEKGLIERSKDDEDKRASLITLKEENVQIEKKDFFEVLSGEEKKTLKDLLNKILDARQPKEND